MKNNKTVSNLLMDIGKARDLIEAGDENEIYKHCNLFYRVQEDVRKYVHRFFKQQQEMYLDFTYADLEELSNEAYEYVKNYQQKFLFKNYEKQLEKIEKLDIETYDSYTVKWSKQMKIDTYLRSLYKTLSYVAIMLKLWQRKEENESFEHQIIEVINSFL